MGEFQSGKWLIGITTYFFLFFTIVYAFVSAAAFHATPVTDVNFQDPGFIKEYGSNRCLGDITIYCVHTNAADNTSCEAISGCNFQTSGNADWCVGTHGFNCSEIKNSSFCNLLGCEWAESASAVGLLPDVGDGNIDPNSASPKFVKIKAALGIITGITPSNISIGLPPAYKWIFAFFLFWLPGFAWLYALYMALPFLH